METIESFTRTDADLGSQFIAAKELTLNFNAEDLKTLYGIESWDSLDEEQIEVLNELMSIILDGVCEYTLV
tara:strand:- start:206 stop:418 length:213 start_codon:yes stop_codon:yes gene_type:complete